MIAALLHDLGHGPFSHTFEGVQKSRSVSKKHEKWTAEIIRNPEGKIRPLLDGFHPDSGFCDAVGDLLEAEDPIDIYHAVVSSAFDADRLDYLRRDRLMTGTKAGAIDFDWLMDQLRVKEIEIEAPDADGSDDRARVPTFCFDRKALPAAEQFLLARYTLHEQVYFHKTTRCVEKMIAKLLRGVARHAGKRGTIKLTGLHETHHRVIIPYVRGCGTTHFLSSATIRNGQQAAVAVDAIDLMNALKIEKAIFAGYDWGGRTADIVAALWPERCKALVSVSGYLIGSPEANKMPLPPKAELQWWYQYYFATERGALGYDKYRHDFAKLIWQIASPKWDFDDATFDRSAAAFDNPDYVAIVIHNYRWRLGLADGERKYDDLDKRLAQGPVVTVPTITLEGDANGAPHPDPASYAKKFSGKYAHRTIDGGVGHNLPQEAPQAFAQAVVDVDGY